MFLCAHFNKRNFILELLCVSFVIDHIKKKCLRRHLCVCPSTHHKSEEPIKLRECFTYYIIFIGIFHVTCLWRVEVAFIRKNKILKWILQISCTFLSSLIKGVLKCIVNMWLRLYHNSERGKHCQWYRIISGSHLEFLPIRVFWRHHQGFEDLVDKQLFGA